MALQPEESFQRSWEHYSEIINHSSLFRVSEPLNYQQQVKSTCRYQSCRNQILKILQRYDCIVSNYLMELTLFEEGFICRLSLNSENYFGLEIIAAVIMAKCWHKLPR